MAKTLGAALALLGFLYVGACHKTPAPEPVTTAPEQTKPSPAAPEAVAPTPAADDGPGAANDDAPKRNIEDEFIAEDVE